LFGYVGIEEVQHDVKCQIFPNPATSELNFSLDQYAEQIKTIELYDMQGKQVIITHPLHTTATMDISLLPEGIYLARVVFEQGVITRKVMKN
jgi:hypothetical protein